MFSRKGKIVNLQWTVYFTDSLFISLVPQKPSIARIPAQTLSFPFQFFLCTIGWAMAVRGVAVSVGAIVLLAVTNHILYKLAFVPNEGLPFLLRSSYYFGYILIEIMHVTCKNVGCNMMLYVDLCWIDIRLILKILGRVCLRLDVW